MYNLHWAGGCYVLWLYWAGEYLCTMVVLGRWIFMYNCCTGQVDMYNCRTGQVTMYNYRTGQVDIYVQLLHLAGEYLCSHTGQTDKVHFSRNGKL